MTDHDPVESAWKIHDAVMDWTAKVDTKANFVLTLESALLAGVFALAGGNRRLAHLHGVLQLVTFWFGIGSLAVALLTVVDVVRPRLRRRQAERESPNNYIFFGHARRWLPEELARRLSDTDLLPVLTRQVVHTSELAWIKHVRLQQSVILAVLGTLSLGVASGLK